tara:strand:- start:1871 stop:2083 length:213 start_codon:yes stop_codon:yes gene_type:complete
MPKKHLSREIEDLKTPDFENNRSLSGEKKVDINILLNRVKIENVKEKKKNVVFIISVLLCICISGYLIFN